MTLLAGAGIMDNHPVHRSSAVCSTTGAGTSLLCARENSRAHTPVLQQPLARQTSTEIASSVMDSRPASLEATAEARCDRP